jgi:hypothetical protein
MSPGSAIPLNILQSRTVLAAAALLLAALPAAAQYSGKVSSDEKEAPVLRSIAVLEWTGDEEKPKASRLVPVAVDDAGQLQDGGIYLARPWPLAVIPEVEYELQQDGKPVGLFDIQNAGQQMGSWVGFGAWKPMPEAHPKLSAKELAKTRLDDEDDAKSDEPVLHRKHHADDTPSGSSAGNSGSGSGSQTQSAPDSDRPVLHKKESGSDNSSEASSAGASNSGASTASSSPPDDPDRPVLHKEKKKSAPADVASVENIPGDTDPDRPRLKRGKSTGDAIQVAPSLLGVPDDLHQEVAVSDSKTRPPHRWNYSWSNPDDEAKMKASLEDMARTALGLNSSPAAAKAVGAKSSSSARPATKKAAKPAAPPEPAPLEGEQFRVFELAYGSGATLVLSAHTSGPPAQQKFVTLIAQPDLYGNVLLLKKNVTDGEHLDETPRMRLIDAVDALADNRGELLFELRGATQRQFALYRVLRGQAEQLFLTGGGQFGVASSE